MARAGILAFIATCSEEELVDLQPHLKRKRPLPQVSLPLDQATERIVCSFLGLADHHRLGRTLRAWMTATGIPMPPQQQRRMWRNTVELSQRTTEAQMVRFASYATPSSLSLSRMTDDIARTLHGVQSLTVTKVMLTTTVMTALASLATLSSLSLINCGLCEGGSL